MNLERDPSTPFSNEEADRMQRQLEEAKEMKELAEEAKNETLGKVTHKGDSPVSAETVGVGDTMLQGELERRSTLQAGAEAELVPGTTVKSPFEASGDDITDDEVENLFK